jgi:hypothetical protein
MGGRTPIVFSGGDATGATIDDISVKGAPVAVAFLGADTDIFDYYPVVDVNNVLLKKIAIEPLPADQAAVSAIKAVFARTTGAVIVDTCPFIPSEAEAERYGVHTGDCMYRTTGIPPITCNIWGNFYKPAAVADGPAIQAMSWGVSPYKHLAGDGIDFPVEREDGVYGMTCASSLDLLGVNVIAVGTDSAVPVFSYDSKTRRMRVKLERTLEIFCVHISTQTHELMCGDCNATAATFYRDPFPEIAAYAAHNRTARIHVDGNPFMCFHADPDTLHILWGPCTQGCAVGIQPYVPCYDTEQPRQHPVVATGSVTHCCATSDPVASCVVANAELCNMCMVEGAFLPTFQHTDYCDEPKDSYSNPLEILACTTNPNGAVHSFRPPLIPGTTTIDATACAHKEHLPHGFLGRIDCSNGGALTSPGYGYFELGGHRSSDITVDKIVIQPLEVDGVFSVVQAGIEVINVSAYTDIYGDIYEASYFSVPINLHTYQLIVLWVLAVLILFFFVLHFGLLYSENKMKFQIERVWQTRHTFM